MDVHSDGVPVTITSHGNGCTGQIMWRQSHLHGGNTAPAPFMAGEQLVQSKRPLLAGWQHSLCLSLTGRCAWLLAYPQVLPWDDLMWGCSCLQEIFQDISICLHVYDMIWHAPLIVFMTLGCLLWLLHLAKSVVNTINAQFNITIFSP